MTETTEEGVRRWVATDDRDSPWNILGRTNGLGAAKGGTVEGMLTADAVLTATGLHLPIRKYPVSIDTSTDRNGSQMVVTPKWWMTGYQLPGEDLVTFAPVSDKYEVVQPVEALSAFDEIALAGDAPYVAGFNLPEKCMMGVVLKMPQEVVIDPEGANDRIPLYILGINSFDGSTGLKGIPIGERLFCTNQIPGLMRNARDNGFSFKHTRNVKGRAAEARANLAKTYEYFKFLQVVGDELYKQKVTDKEFERIISQLEPWAVKDDMGDLQKARAKDRQTEALNAWRAPHNENITGTKWGVLNVVTEYAQWGRVVQGSPRTGSTPERQRAIGTMVHPTVEGLGRKALDILAPKRFAWYEAN